MAAFSSTTFHQPAYLGATRSIHVKPKGPVSSLPFSRFSTPNFGISHNNFVCSRLQICHSRNTAPKKLMRMPVTFCLIGGNSEAYPETEQICDSNDDPKNGAEMSWMCVIASHSLSEPCSRAQYAIGLQRSFLSSKSSLASLGSCFSPLTKGKNSQRLHSDI